MSGSVTFLGHSTVLVELAGRRVLTDPVVRDRVTFLRRVHAAPDPAHHADLDLVVISHLHHDHLDLRSLRLLGAGSRVPLVVPVGAGRFLRRKGFAEVDELAVGRSVSLDGGATVQACRAVHSGRREPFGPDAEAVGYALRDGGTAVWFAGDTDGYPEMAELGPIDVGLVPVWGWGPTLGDGHLDPRSAAEILHLARPRVAVPVHWGTLWPSFLTRRHHRLVGPPAEFARVAAAIGAPSAVRILQPGECLAIG